MPITEKQREQRRKRVMSSDVAAILGMDPWGRNAYDIWLEKTGRVARVDGNEAMEAGTRFEGGLLDWAEKRVGKIRRNQYRAHPEVRLGAHCDAIVVATGEPLEAKTAGLFGPIRQRWGTPGTDEVPEYVICQVTAQIMCCFRDRGLVAAFLGGRGFSEYYVPRNEKLVRAISDAVCWIWEHVEEDRPPKGLPGSPESIRRMIRVPRKTISIPETVAARFLAARAEYHRAKSNLEAARHELLAHFGDAEIGVAAGYQFRYEVVRRRVIDAERLRQEHADVARRVTRENEYRVLKVKEAEVTDGEEGNQSGHSHQTPGSGPGANDRSGHSAGGDEGGKRGQGRPVHGGSAAQGRRALPAARVACLPAPQDG